MKNPLLVNALELLRRPGSERPVEIDVAPESIQIVDDRLAPGADISVRLVCASLSDGIVVEGLVTAHFRGDCRRCLAPVAGELECSIRELYQVNLTDPDAFPIVNDQIDLSVMVRETVLLDLPDAPVCRVDCAGLCAVCGLDLNTGTCTCETALPDSRWSALDALRDQLPE